MRRIIVEDESDEEDKAELPNYKKLINEIVKKHNIYTYNDIYLCECEITNFLNNYNMSEEESEYIDEDHEEDDHDYSTIHNKYIIKPIRKYTDNLIKNLINKYDKHYKETLLVTPYKFINIPKELRYYDCSTRYSDRRIPSNDAKIYMHIDCPNDRYLTLNYIENKSDSDTEYITQDESEDENFTPTKEFIQTTASIETNNIDKDKLNKYNDKYNSEFFHLTYSFYEYTGKTEYIEDDDTDETYAIIEVDKYKKNAYTKYYDYMPIFAGKIAKSIYEESTEHLKWFYCDREANTESLLYILITNRVLRTITKHIKFYKRVKEFKRKIAIKNILRSKTYNYGLGLKLSMRGCGLELTNS